MSLDTKLNNNNIFFYSNNPGVAVKITGNLNQLSFFGSSNGPPEVRLSNIALPVSLYDATNKLYVDNKSNYDAIIATSGTPYTALSNALNLGFTNIYVKSGVYIESTPITSAKSNITIVGENVENTIIRGNFSLSGILVNTGALTLVSNSSNITSSDANAFLGTTTGYYIFFNENYYNMLSVGGSNNIGVLNGIYRGISNTNVLYSLSNMKSVNISNISFQGSLTFSNIINSSFNNIKVTSNEISFTSSGNLNIVNSKINNSISNGLSLNYCGCSNIIDNNILNNNNFGLFLGACKSLNINNNIINTNINHALCVSGLPTNNISINNCQLSYNSGYGIFMDQLIQIAKAGNVAINNCNIDYNNNNAVFLAGGSIINNCNITLNNGVGIQASNFCNLNNLNILGNNNHGIFIISTSNINITNCLIRLNGGDGIRATSTYKTLINGSNITTNAGFGINLTGAFNALITDNQLYDNVSGTINNVGTNCVFIANMPETNDIPVIRTAGKYITFNTTDSTSLGTGAIVIATGGLSVNGAIISSGRYINTSTIDYIDNLFVGTGALILQDGGLSVRRSIQAAGPYISYNTQDSTSLGTAAIIAATGGLSVNGSIRTNGAFISASTGLFIENISVAAPYIFYGRNVSSVTINSISPITNTNFSNTLYGGPQFITSLLTNLTAGYLQINGPGIYLYGYNYPCTLSAIGGNSYYSLISAMITFSTNTINWFTLAGSMSSLVTFRSAGTTSRAPILTNTNILAITNSLIYLRFVPYVIAQTGATTVVFSCPVTAASWWFQKMRNF